MRWMIYTDSLSSMLTIENNRENHPILNQILDILAELYNQRKQITLRKVPVQILIKGNEEADYYLIIRKARNSAWKREWENNTKKLY